MLITRERGEVRFLGLGGVTLKYEIKWFLYICIRWKDSPEAKISERMFLTIREQGKLPNDKKGQKAKSDKFKYLNETNIQIPWRQNSLQTCIKFPGMAKNENTKRTFFLCCNLFKD